MFFLLFFVGISVAQRTQTQPCELLDGRSELILDVTESLGQDFSQPIFPEELPIFGTSGVDIKLKLLDVARKRFKLNSKKISLIHPLDRDDEKLSTIRFEMSCEWISSGSIRIIPVVVRVNDLNDNAPQFLDAPYSVSVKENARVGSPIFNGIRAIDKDSGRNGQVEYHIVNIKPGNSKIASNDLNFDTFDSKVNSEKKIFDIRFPHQGTVFLNSRLDFETNQIYNVTIVATDLSPNETERRQSFSFLTINILDVDDLDPVFETAALPSICADKNSGLADRNSADCMPEYYSSVIEGRINGILDIKPGLIRARDLDSFGAPVVYFFDSGKPRWALDHFSIDPRTGVVRQTKAVRRKAARKFEFFIQAIEDTSRRGRTTVKLLINVEKVDTAPPKLLLESGSTGKVLEGSRPGTPVLTQYGTPFKLSVYDPDYEKGELLPLYVFELTTNSFRVNSEGVLVVASDRLDKDPPNLAQHSFQVIAREIGEKGAASAPETLKVKLLDVNDNAPRLPIMPAISVPAGNFSRVIAKIKANDIDEGENALVTYSIVGGSMGKFRIDSNSGVLQTIDKLTAGEKYTLVIRATDTGNLSGEGTLEIGVSRGPNSHAPVFSKPHYFVSVPENATFGETVLRVYAQDKEGDSVYYSMLEGNEEKRFEIDSTTGTITIVAFLDREHTDQYSLLIKAEDSEGKNSKAKVTIKLTDINDVSPTFVSHLFSKNSGNSVTNSSKKFLNSAENSDNSIQPLINSGNSILTGENLVDFSFRVDEGEQDAYVGTVKAIDQDLGEAGRVTYLIDPNVHHPNSENSLETQFHFQNSGISSQESKIPISQGSRELESYFKVDAISGNISTLKALDYEKQQVYYLPIIARDSGTDPRKSTATVTILVNDIKDENPVFSGLENRFVVQENTPVGERIGVIKAVDPDSVSEITYKMVSGNSDLFKLAPKTGEIFLAGNLDYEKGSNYTLVFGTEENSEKVNEATTKVYVEVKDLNDEPPIIEKIHAITLAQNAPIGTLVTKVNAKDRDLHPPNNQILYSLGMGGFGSYFKIDENLGEIRTNKLLNDIQVVEFKLKVSVRDQGSPILSSSADIRILLLKSTIGAGAFHPDAPLGEELSSRLPANLASAPRFSKERLLLYVNENIPNGSVVLKVPLINATAPSIACSIVEGNELGTFKSKVTPEGNCQIMASKTLDYEEKPAYNLSLALHPREFGVNFKLQNQPILSRALIQLYLNDVNDNAPTFKLNDKNSFNERLTLIEGLEAENPDVELAKTDTFVLSFVLENSDVGTAVFRLEAQDPDSGKFGEIHYSLLPESNRGSYFKVNRTTGVVLLHRKLKNVPAKLVPFNLSFVAADNEGDPSHRSSVVRIIVPVIKERHENILLFDSTKNSLQDHLQRIKRGISQFTGKFVQIEAIKSPLAQKTQSIKLPSKTDLKRINSELRRENLKSATQLWFHLLDKNSWEPVFADILYEDKNKFFEKIFISSGLPPLDLVPPNVLKEIENPQETRKAKKPYPGFFSGSILNLSTLEYSLIALAGFIILFVLAAMFSICVLWSKYTKKWRAADKTVLLVPPIITRPSSVIDSVSKEYEVQVLHMSVSVDDDSSALGTSNGPAASRKNPYLGLDNVSYISKSRTNLDYISSSESSDLVTPSHLRREFSPQERNFSPQEREFIPQERNFSPQEREFLPQERNFSPQGRMYLPQEDFSSQRKEFFPHTVQETEYLPHEVSQSRNFSPHEREYIFQNSPPPRRRHKNIIFGGEGDHFSGLLPSKQLDRSRNMNSSTINENVTFVKKNYVDLVESTTEL